MYLQETRHGWHKIVWRESDGRNAIDGSLLRFIWCSSVCVVCTSLLSLAVTVQWILLHRRASPVWKWLHSAHVEADARFSAIAIQCPSGKEFRVDLEIRMRVGSFRGDRRSLKFANLRTGSRLARLRCVRVQIAPNPFVFAALHCSGWIRQRADFGVVK